MTESPVIIYGPPSCGKTARKEALARVFNKPIIIDSWDHQQPLPDNAIAFTNSPINDAIPFEEAINLLGDFNDQN
jgi:hypothetical protein